MAWARETLRLIEWTLRVRESAHDVHGGTTRIRPRPGLCAVALAAASLTACDAEQGDEAAVTAEVVTWICRTNEPASCVEVRPKGVGVAVLDGVSKKQLGSGMTDGNGIARIPVHSYRGAVDVVVTVAWDPGLKQVHHGIVSSTGGLSVNFGLPRTIYTPSTGTPTPAS